MPVVYLVDAHCDRVITGYMPFFFTQNSYPVMVAVSSPQIESVKPAGAAVLDYSRGDYNCYQQREHGGGGRVKLQQLSKGDGLSLSSVHPMRALEDDIDYDSNASSSSFEFQGERSVNNPIGRSHLRPKSSKWNDAEKWIMNRQVNHLKSSNSQSQAVRMQVKNGIGFASESASNDNKSAVKRVDFCQPPEQMSMEKFSFLSSVAQPTGQGNGTNLPIDVSPQSKDLEAVESKESSCMTVSGDGSTCKTCASTLLRLFQCIGSFFSHVTSLAFKFFMVFSII